MTLKADIHQAMEQAARRRTCATVDDLTLAALAGVNDSLVEWLGPVGALNWWRRWAREVRELEEHNYDE